MERKEHPLLKLLNYPLWIDGGPIIRAIIKKMKKILIELLEDVKA